ncbi:MAG: hypothetical protein BWX74_00899 [Tenericutes bacterium ADurb.Bin087]|nr:MAG: hypothetical protein BWX74_00899 [Tenericutes bacterium ADurb.Bin087]
MIEVGNVYYFIELLIPVIVISVTYHLLKNKTLNFQYTYLFIWCLLGFILHFAKQLVYQDISQLSKSTAENICAVSTLVFPFIMMIKKKNVLHDFMFLIGLVGGGAGLLYPTEALGESLFTFETIRFYFCHMSLLAIPLLLALLNIREPDLKKWWVMPLLFLAYETIIMLNTALLTFTGLATREGFTPLQLFIDRQYLNNSFVFGPTPDMGIVGETIGNMTFPFMKTDIFNLTNGDEFYWPIIWLLIPSYIIFVPLYTVLALPFRKKHEVMSLEFV